MKKLSNLDTRSLIAGAVIATLAVTTAIQHVQLSSMKQHIEDQPSVAVVDIDTLGTVTALAGNQARPKLLTALGDVSNAGYVVVDQAAVLTAPSSAVMSPLTFMEIAGIDITPSMRLAATGESSANDEGDNDQGGVRDDP